MHEFRVNPFMLRCWRRSAFDHCHKVVLRFGRRLALSGFQTSVKAQMSTQQRGLIGGEAVRDRAIFVSEIVVHYLQNPANVRDQPRRARDSLGADGFIARLRKP